MNEVIFANREMKCRRKDLCGSLKQVLFLANPMKNNALLEFLDLAEERYGTGDLAIMSVIDNLRKVIQRIMTAKKVVSQFHIAMFVENLGMDTVENFGFMEDLLRFLNDIAINQVS